MVPRSHTALGLVVGAAAGALLGVAVLPLGLSWSGYGHVTALAFYLRPWVWLTTLLMAAGGLGITRSRHAVEAIKASSLAGLLAGAAAAAGALEVAPPLLAAAGLTGWIYGLLAGLPLLRLAGGGHHEVAAPLPATAAVPAAEVPAGPAPRGLDGDSI